MPTRPRPVSTTSTTACEVSPAGTTARFTRSLYRTGRPWKVSGAVAIELRIPSLRALLRNRLAEGAPRKNEVIRRKRVILAVESSGNAGDIDLNRRDGE